MTIIAWDGKTLAAGRAGYKSGCSFNAPKLRSVKVSGVDHWIGFCGSLHLNLEVIKWLEGKRDRPSIRNYDADADPFYDMAILIPHQTRKLFVMHSAEFTINEFPNQLFSVGSCTAFAMGAMHSGATSVEAVRLAIKHTDQDAIGVDYVGVGDYSIIKYR